MNNMPVNSSVIGTYTGKSANGDVMNNNSMRLSRELFEKLFASKEYKQAMANKHYIGFLGHPEDPNCMDFKQACIVMTECHLEDNGDVVASFDLIDTPVGRVVKSFIDAGVKFGISIRGAGDVDSAGNVDPDTFVFRGFDLVTFPAYEDAIPDYVAASTDIRKQVRIKAIYAAIESALPSITDKSTLTTLTGLVPDNSDIRKSLDTRFEELSNVDPNDTDIISMLEQRLNGVMQLYLRERERAENAEMAARDTEIVCSRKIKSLKRISDEQLSNLKKHIRRIEASSNLKYRSKTYSQTVSEPSIRNDDVSYHSTHKTVMGRTRYDNTSNRDATFNINVSELEDILLSYQQAYANLYADVLGVRVDNIAVTATTSVSELRRMISGGTSTSNIAAKPASIDLIDVGYVDDIDNDDSMIII